jgi:hypothetical protein
MVAETATVREIATALRSGCLRAGIVDRACRRRNIQCQTGLACSDRGTALRRPTIVTRAASSGRQVLQLCGPSAPRDRRLRRGVPERPAARSTTSADHLADRRRTARISSPVRQHPLSHPVPALGESGGALARAEKDTGAVLRPKSNWSSYGCRTSSAGWMPSGGGRHELRPKTRLHESAGMIDLSKWIN